MVIRQALFVLVAATHLVYSRSTCGCWPGPGDGRRARMIQHWQRMLSGSVIYPESDGLPLADNTKQARWIVVLFCNLSALFRAAADVFVAADHFWYPVEGDPNERLAPDVFVVLG